MKLIEGHWEKQKVRKKERRTDIGRRRDGES